MKELYFSTVTTKGTVTVPVEIRKKLGLVPGTIVAIRMRGDAVLVEKDIQLQDVRAKNRALLNKRKKTKK